MLHGEDFLLEDGEAARKKKEMAEKFDKVKKVTMGFLGKALNFYKRASSGDSSPTLVGKANAYLTAFLENAVALGLDKSKYSSIVSDLGDKIGKLLLKVHEDSQKTIIEHRRDPKGVEVELLQAKLKDRELQLRELKVVDDRKPSDSGKESEVHLEDNGTTVDEVVQWLHKSMLGFDKADAERRARAVYRPGASVEELVAAACRLP